jgi:hypothetical protein
MKKTITMGKLLSRKEQSRIKGGVTARTGECNAVCAPGPFWELVMVDSCTGPNVCGCPRWNRYCMISCSCFE